MIWRKKCIHGLLRLLAFPFLATLSFSACCSLKWSSSALRSRPGHAQIRPSNERLPRTCPLWEKMVEFSFNFWHNQTKSNHSVFLVMLIICLLLSQLNEYISVLIFKYILLTSVCLKQNKWRITVLHNTFFSMWQASSFQCWRKQ